MKHLFLLFAFLTLTSCTSKTYWEGIQKVKIGGEWEDLRSEFNDESECQAWCQQAENNPQYSEVICTCEEVEE